MQPVTLVKTQSTTQLTLLTWKFNYIEERLHHLKQRCDLFSNHLSGERLFSNLPARLEKIREWLRDSRMGQQAKQSTFEELIVMLTDLEADLKIRELLQAQRSLINYLSRQEEVYASLSRRWQHLTNSMVAIDSLALSDPELANRKRHELEQGLKELEECLHSNTTPAATPRMAHHPPQRFIPLAQVG